MRQFKNTFDSVTIKKIGKGSVYALASAAIIYLLQATGMELGEASALATSFIMALIGVINFLKTADLKKIGTGLFFAAGSSLMVYILQEAPSIDFGTYTPIVTALSAIFLNMIKEYRAGIN